MNPINNTTQCYNTRIFLGLSFLYHPSAPGGAEAIDLEAALSAQQQVVVDTLRCPPLPMAMCPPGAVVYGQERSVIGSEEGGRVEVTIVIAVPTPAAVAKAVLQVRLLLGYMSM